MEYRSFSVSFYSKMNIWNEILREGIKPLISNENPGKRIRKFYIEFSRYKGDNIVLFIESVSEDALKLANYISAHMESFFQTKGYHVSVERRPLNNDIFLPFGRNTVQFGLLLPMLGDNTIVFYRLQNQISVLMIEVFSDDMLDSEAIWTFAFLLHMGWIKSISENDSDCRLQPAEILNRYQAIGQLYHMKIEDNHAFQHLFAENNAFLKAAFDNVFNPSLSFNNFLPNWFDRWNIILKEEVYEKWPKMETKAKNTTIHYLIMKHLNLSNKVSSMIHFFLIKGLKEFI